MNRYRIITVILVLVSMTVSQASHAQVPDTSEISAVTYLPDSTITVNTVDDELNSDGDCSLREAIQAANTDAAVDACPAGSGVDTIYLPANTYTLSIPSTNEDANLDGDLDIASDILLQGAGAAATIIQAGTGWQNGIARVLQVLAGSEVTVADVTIQYGLATGNSPHNRGGGIYNDGGTVTVTNSILFFNRAYGSDSIYGGGIYNNGGTINLTNSMLDSNRVEYYNDGRGGGIYNNNGVVTLDHSVLQHNNVQIGFDGYGGGIYVAGGAVTIVDSTLDDNHAYGDAAEGGAIYNSGGTVLLTNSTLSNNRSSATMGGGIGGGIYNQNGGTVTITASTLRNNIAQGADYGAGIGGGIYTSPSGTVQLTNSTLSGNTATDSGMGDPGRGGGINNTGGTVILSASTLSGNQATDGGGVRNSGTMNATNSIIAGSVGADCSGTIISNDYNIDGDGTCSLTQSHDQPNTDPRLDPLADNGGPTWTHALQTESPAIDAGNCSGGTITQDQRGVARPQSIACDIGAYELVAGILAVNDEYETLEDAPLTVTAPGVLLNDWGENPLTATLILSPTNGMLVLNLDGSFVYTPTLDFNGVIGFAYIASDGTITDTATVSITVTPVNDAPIAMDDTYTATEDVVLTIPPAGLLGNDSDVDGDTLQVITAIDSLSGTVAANLDGSFAYTPTLNFNGVDWFTYIASDGVLTDTAVVTVAVSAVNDAPVAVNDTFTTPEDSPLTVVITDGLLLNDHDADGDPLIIVDNTSSMSGTVALNPDGTFIYTPTLNFNGRDWFDYTVSDGVLTATATVAITVTAINDAPIAMGETYTATAGITLTVTAPGILENDFDVDSELLTAVLVTPPVSGVLALKPDGSFVYFPAPDFTGMVSFEYYVSDGYANSDPVTATIEVLRGSHWLYLPIVARGQP